MRRPWRGCKWLLPDIRAGLLVLLGAAVASPTPASPLDELQLLRESGCGGLLPASPPLQRQPVLDRIAARWAQGLALGAAAARESVDASRMMGLRVRAPANSLLAPLRQVSCSALGQAQMHGVGLYRAGVDTWIVLTPSLRIHQPGGSRSPSALSTPTEPVASEVTPPAMPRASMPAPLLAQRALELINGVRSHGTRCGSRWFSPVAGVALSTTLGGVALGHAADMADHDYFEHADLEGRTPADRVRAAGYREKLVGENIAYGPTSVEEVVQGWVDSPGHCENIMDPRFSEMGIAMASGRSSRRGLYWVQLLAAPRA